MYRKQKVVYLIMAITLILLQWCILRPLLFIMFINDLPSAASSPILDPIYMFADDTKFFMLLKAVQII